jgi:hypothetical protein
MRGSAVRARAVAARVLLVIGAGLSAALLACGETRNPIGEECLRGDDCLSGVCSARTCIAAPGLVTGGGPPPSDELPRIPTAEGGAPPMDAQAEGG